MLRCRPSEISLTLADINETKCRLAARQAAAARSSIHATQHSMAQVTVPRVRRGPERSRDVAVRTARITPPLQSAHLCQGPQAPHEGFRSASEPPHINDLHGRYEQYGDSKHYVAEYDDPIEDLSRRVSIQLNLDGAFDHQSDLNISNELRQSNVHRLRQPQTLPRSPLYQAQAVSPEAGHSSAEAASRWTPRRRPRPSLPERTTSYSSPNLTLLQSSVDSLVPSRSSSLRLAAPPEPGRLSGNFGIARRDSHSSDHSDCPPILEVLRNRLSPLDRLEHNAAFDISRAPSVASFYTASSGAGSGRFRLPTFGSPDRSSQPATPPDSPESIVSTESDNLAPQVEPQSPTKRGATNHSHHTSSSEFDFSPKDAAPPASPPSPRTPPARVAPIAPKTSLRLPRTLATPRTPVFRDGDRPTSLPATAPRIPNTAPHRLSAPQRFGFDSLPDRRYTQRRHVSGSLPQWQHEQENSGHADEARMRAEVESVRARTREAQFLDDTPPREGRFERMGRGVV